MINSFEDYLQGKREQPGLSPRKVTAEFGIITAILSMIRELKVVTKEMLIPIAKTLGARERNTIRFKPIIHCVRPQKIFKNGSREMLTLINGRK